MLKCHELYLAIGSSTVVNESYGHFGAGNQEDLGLGLKVGEKYFGTSVVTYTAVDKWYKRDEGNSWRPIAANKMNDFKVPPWLQGNVDQSSIKKFGKFHFSKLRRNVDIEMQRKQRRRLWMMKAYRIATANRGTVCTELAGKVDVSEAYHDSRIRSNAMPFVGMSSGSVKNRSDAEKVRMCNNWCPNGSNDDRVDDESKGLPGLPGHFLSNHGSVFDTKYSAEGVSLPSAPASEESTRAVATKHTRNDCEDDSEMLKWR